MVEWQLGLPYFQDQQRGKDGSSMGWSVHSNCIEVRVLVKEEIVAGSISSSV